MLDNAHHKATEVTIFHIFELLGGLALFLYGMNRMSVGLKKVAGKKLKGLVKRFTTNRWIGAGMGALVTALIQSSTATIVMAVGFVNAGLMTLFGATAIIIGANVGTTISSMLLTFNIKPYAPLLIFIGAMLVLFIRQKKLKNTGLVFLGFGLLFLGLTLMSDSMSPLKDVPFMAELFEHTRNPFIGILVGFTVTAIIQSSTATIGIILSMIAAGVITDLNQAIFILYGLNLGGTITPFIASIGTNKPAKRTAVANLLFNLLGVMIFIILGFFHFDLAALVKQISDQVEQQLVFAHIIFNVVITIALLPFIEVIVRAAKALIPGDEDEEDDEEEEDDYTPSPDRPVLK